MRRAKSDEQPAATDRPAAKLAGLGKVSWAFADQALISATNFVTIILLARGLTQEGLGEFTLVYSALLFVNSIQAGIVTQPHNILGVSHRGDDYKLYTTSTAVSQLLLCGLATLITIIAWGTSAALHSVITPLLLALAPTIVAWQLQEFVRRVLYTEAREAKAFVTDVIGYGGQVIAIVLLGRRGHLTGTSTLYAIAWTSAAAAVYGLWEIRRSLGLRIDRKLILGNWHFGKWIAGGEIVGHWMSAQMFVYLAAAMLGAAAAGVLRIVHTVLGPCRVLADVLCTVLPIRFSRALAQSGEAGLRVQMRVAYLVSVPLLGSYCLLVAVFARPVLHLFFHGRYDDSAPVLAAYSVAAFTSYLMMILAAALRAKRLTRDLFNGQLYASVISLPIGWLLIRAFGVQGTALGMLVTYAAMIVLFDRAFRRDATEAATAPGSGALLTRVFALFDRANVPYCVTHGYERYPDAVRSDVDLVMPRAFVRKHLAALLAGNASVIGARVVQWLREGTDYVVLMGTNAAGDVEHVCLDVTTDYVLADRTFLSTSEILGSRRRHENFWVSAPDVEFACTLLRRITKRKLDDRHAERLSALHREAPAACDAIVVRFLRPRDVELVRTAATSGDWTPVRGQLNGFRRRLLFRASALAPLKFIGHRVARTSRRISRHLRPRHGLHVVFLGPDGAGKSSVVRAVRERVGPAFFATASRSFPPALLNSGDPTLITLPHAAAPRSAFSSAFRAVAYWWTYHAPGHLLTVRRDLSRGRLVLHDRHLIDVQVDPRRYRYAGPAWLMRLVCRWTPSPDLVVVLDAPVDLIQSRKQEVEPRETERQLTAYRALAKRLGSRAILVDASRSLADSVAAVEAAILNRLAARTSTGDASAYCDTVRSLLAERGSASTTSVREDVILRYPEGSAQPDAPARFFGVPQNDIAATTVRELGSGDQAFLYEVSSENTAPRVIKLFRAGKPEAAAAAADELAALQLLHAAVDGALIDGWRMRTPLPLAGVRGGGAEPLALVMDKVPGVPLQSLLADGLLDNPTLDAVAKVLATALRRYWAASPGRIYGDFNLDNVLCDPDQRVLSLVDPGMPERAFDCPAADRAWYPASRDLAYVLFDTATSIRSSIFKPALRRRQWRLVTGLVRFSVDDLTHDADERRSLIDEIRACCKSHLRRIATPFSPRGLGRRAVRIFAAIRMSQLLRHVARDGESESPALRAAAKRDGGASAMGQPRLEAQ